MNDLPGNVDPCGENGEYHSFVFEAPFFSGPVQFETGEVVYRKYTAPAKDDPAIKADGPFDNGFWYCDRLPSFE